MKTMAAGEFKNRCLAIMDQVQKSGEPLLITKHGKPVAKLIPAATNGDDIFDSLAGMAKITGDIMTSTPLEDWECK